MTTIEENFGKLKIYFKLLISDYIVVILICPCFFSFIFSNDLNIIAINSLVYRKLCLGNFNLSICNNIYNYSNVSHKVQEMASLQQIFLNVTFVLPAILAIIHLAGMADRKLNYETPLLISALGCSMNVFICIFATDQSTDICMNLLYLAQAINGICGGGSLAFISSCFSHISVYEELVDKEDKKVLAELNYKDEEKKKKFRAIRFSLCEAFLLLGQFTGSLASGYLIGNKLELSNFKRTFIVSLAIYLFVILYVICMFKYLSPRKSKIHSQLNNEITTVNSNSNKIVAQVKGLFNFKNQIEFLKDTYKILAKKRKYNARFQIISLLFIYFVAASISMGLSPIQYLYLIKKPIQFSQIQYGKFKTFNVLTRTSSQLFFLPLFKHFSMPDYYLYLIGITSEFLNLIAFSAASAFKQVIWIAPLVYMFSNYFVVCIRLFASKLVEKNETGKIFGIIALVEFLVFLTSSNVISLVYNKTVSSFPWLIYVICIFVCVFICYPYLIYIIRDLKKNQILQDNGIINDTQIEKNTEVDSDQRRRLDEIQITNDC